MELTWQVLHSVHEMEAAIWDRIAGGQPFQSHRWYAYGEHVMADCLPVYLVAWLGDRAVGRATFFLIRNEPLPLSPWLRGLLQLLLRRWPLLICRSPLSSTSGLILPEPPLRGPALETLLIETRRLARQYGASFVMFDFLEAAQLHWPEWPEDFAPITVPEPGTRMEIVWSSFEEYLDHLSPRARKHYRQHRRAAERKGVTITSQSKVTELEAALRLMRAVERRHRAAPNPWARRMLEEAWRVDALWLAARMDGRLVGCELILADGSTQIVTALGLEAGLPEVYFLLGYADIEYAIQKGMRTLRWGSGAYEAKRRLGFEKEENNHAMVWSRGMFRGARAWLQ